MIDPPKGKKPPFDPNKPHEAAKTSGSKPKFDWAAPFNPVEEQDQEEVKKKDPENSDLQSENGSSELPTTKANKTKKEPKFPGTIRSDVKLTDVDLVPEKAPNTDPLNIKSGLGKISNKELIAKAKPLVSAYRSATNLTEEDDAEVEKRLEDRKTTSGFMNNVEEKFGMFVNYFKTGAFVKDDPLIDEKKEVLKEAAKAGKSYSPDLIQSLAEDKYKAKMRESIYVDRANSFLENLSDEQRTTLRAGNYAERTHLGQENKKRLNALSVLKTSYESDIDDYETLSAQAQAYTARKQAIPEDLVENLKAKQSELESTNETIRKTYQSVLKTTDDLGTAQEEYDLFRRENGDMENFGKRVGIAIQDFGVGLIDSFAMASQNSGPGMFFGPRSSLTTKMRASIEKEREGLRKQTEEIESWEGFVNYATDLVADQSVNLTAAATGGLAGLSVIGASSTGRKYGEMADEVNSGKAKYTPLQMVGVPLLWGGAEVISEIPTLRMLKNAQRVFAAAGKTESALLKQTFRQKATEWAKDYGIDMSREMAGEQFANFTQNFADRYLLGKEDVGLLDNTGKIFKDTFTLTSLLKTPALGGLVHRTFQKADQMSELDENAKKIMAFADQLENGDLNDKERAVIESRMGKAVKKSTGIIESTISTVGNMSDEQYMEFLDITKRAGRLKASAETINNGNLPNKEMLLKDLEQEYNILKTRRNEILDTASKPVETAPSEETSEAEEIDSDSRTKAQEEAAEVLSPLTFEEEITPNPDETTPEGDSSANGDIQPGAEFMEPDPVAEQQSSEAEEVQAPADPGASPYAAKTDSELETRLAELDDTAFSVRSPEHFEYDAIENELQQRERASIFNVPLDKVNKALAALSKKDKTMPNGYGTFIDQQDIKETRAVVKKYSGDLSSMTDEQVMGDFVSALRGKPTTWAADGLQLRESAKEAANRGITFETLLGEAQEVYTKEGIDQITAQEIVKQFIEPVFSGAKPVTASAPTTPMSNPVVAEAPAVTDVATMPEAQQKEVTAAQDAPKGKSPKTKAEKKAIAEAKIDEVADWLKAVLPKAAIDPNEYNTQGFSQDQLIDFIAAAAKKLAATGIEINEAVNQVINALSQKFDFEITAEEVLKKVDPGTALKNADIAKKRAELGFESRGEVVTKKNETLVKEATKKIEEGYDVTELIDEIMDIGSKRALTDEEVVILKQYQLAKEDELIKINEQIVEAAEKGAQTRLDKLTEKRDSVIDDIDKAYRAGEQSGTVSARALQARRIALISDFSLANMLIRKRKANNGAKLTSEQIQKTVNDYEKIKKLKEDFEAKLKKLQQENTRLKAEKNLSKYQQRKQVRSEKTEKIDKDIQEAKDKLRQRIRESMGRVSSNPIPIEFTADVVKLATLYSQKGIVKLEDIVDDLFESFKEDIPGLTKFDIEEMIADIDFDEEAANEKRLDGFKKRTRKSIDEKSKRLANKDFAKRTIKPIKLDAEAIALQDELRKVKYEWEKALENDRLANRTSLERARDGFTEVFNVPRSVMASVDFSAPLRQGLLFTVTKPIIASKAFVEMFKQAVSQKRFDRWLDDLKESPQYEVMKKSGLYISDARSAKLSAREEQFMSNLADKIPVLGKGFTVRIKGKKIAIGGLNLIGGSERAYVSYLNKMRADVFAKAVEQFENDGIMFEDNPKLYKAMADYVNSATGRGHLGKLENSAQILNSTFFSPRLIASRVRLLTNWANPVWYAETPNKVKLMYLKDMSSMIAIGTTILALASLAGADVETDPRSSDFGKIRHGDTRWDIWGGFQQFVRFFAQVATAQRKSTTDGYIREIDGTGWGGETRADIVLQMFRSKLAPVPATAWNLASGQTMVGEEYELSDVPASFAPLFASDLIKAIDRDGLAKGSIETGLPAVLGVGVQNYNRDK